MIHAERPNIEMLEGGVALARRGSVDISVLPIYKNLIDGSAQRAGWSERPYFTEVSGRVYTPPLPGRASFLFGNIDIHGGTSIIPVRLKSGEHATEAHDILKFFINEQNTPILAERLGVLDWWNPNDPTGNPTIIEYDAFALVPGKHLKSKNRPAYAKSVSKADAYRDTKSWKLFRGLFYIAPETNEY